MTYERQFFTYLENMKRRILAQPLVLGGVSSSGGGVGGPAGGFVGQLPQSRVTFDKLEEAVNTIPESGASLLDNLNRIRYDIANISGVASAVEIQQDDVVTNSEATILNFEGTVDTLDEGGGKVTITISGGGGGGSDLDAIHVDTANEITGITQKSVPVNNDEFVIEDSEASYVKKALTYANLESNLSLTESQISNLDHTDLDAFHDNEANEFSSLSEKTTTSGADLLVIEDSEDSGNKKKLQISNLPVGGGGDIEVQENDAQVVATATVLNFEGGASVTDEGSGKATITVSGGGSGTDSDAIHDNVADEINQVTEKTTPADADVLILEDSESSWDKKKVQIGNLPTASGGGGSLAVKDEGTQITSSAASMDFVGKQVEAVDSGGDVTVTVSGYMVDPPDFIGVRAYPTSDWQVGTTNGWQVVNYDTENYDTDNLYSSGGNFNINTEGYYNFTAVVTVSGDLPTNERIQVGIFKQNTLAGQAYGGYYNSSTGVYSFPISTDMDATASDWFNVRILVGDSSQPTVLSGQNTFFSAHMIRGVVASVEDTPPAVKTEVNNYDNDISSDTWTDVQFNDEIYDTDTMFDSTSSRTDVNINTSGIYNIKLVLLTHAQNGETFNIAQRIRVNDTTTIAVAYDETIDNGGDRVEGRALVCSTDYELDKNDVITAQIWHDRGSSHNDFIRLGDGASYITAHRVGPKSS